jgi:hypothetical protein
MQLTNIKTIIPLIIRISPQAKRPATRSTVLGELGPSFRILRSSYVEGKMSGKWAKNIVEREFFSMTIGAAAFTLYNQFFPDIVRPTYDDDV